MRSEAEIQQLITHLRTLVEQYRSQGRSAPSVGPEAGAAYVQAMYCSAALHALQWAVGDTEELLLQDKALQRKP
jgi:hypothetical protein